MYTVKITYTGINRTKRDYLWWNCSYFAISNFILFIPVLQFIMWANIDLEWTN